MKKIFLVAGIILLPFGILAFQAAGGDTDSQYSRDENFITSADAILSIGILSSLALFIGIVSLIMVFPRRNRAKLARSADKAIPKTFFPSNDDLGQGKKWEAEYGKLETLVADLKVKLSDFENRVKAFEDDGRVVEFKVEKADRTSAAQHSPTQEILYAKLPDTYDGFSAAILSSEQDGEKIYEITSAGESATFQISEDKDAQKYALSDYNYYLGNACTMENAPEKDSRIVTEVPGKLIRRGKDWMIETKALIKFI